ncbi:MAG: hypothetical protein IJO61_09130 [Oscillospiraceae bacterium]|nr:hypothetical protein [Oscillospiraceae bacterium]
MFVIKMADMCIGIENKYDYIHYMCRDYITDEKAEFTVSVTDEEIMRESEGQEGFPSEYLETLAIYRKICDKASGKSCFLMHGVLMSAENQGILLCAESGTGKSTHAALWTKLLGDKCEIVNGDKPLIRVIDGIPYAYGTPWCGKEEINVNKKVRLSDICFIKRSAENRVTEVEKSLITQTLIPHIHIPENGDVITVLDSIDATAKNVMFYTVECNMDISAAKTAYDIIIK